jgi:mono/diheme cytochrome c family protein
MKRILIAGLTAAALAGLLAACAKSSQSASSTSSTATSAAATATASAAAVAQNGAMASDGGKVYETNCSSCHQASGQGVKGSFPPLAGNPVVVGDPKTVIHVVKYGLSGNLTVKGHKYNGMMPAWGKQLSNADIASVITFIRSSWGNSASAVTTAQVAGVSQ